MNLEPDLGQWLDSEAIPLVDQLDDHGGCGALTPRNQAIYLIWNLLGDVGNGGSEQYFFNCGHLVKHTLEILQRIGAEKTASRLAQLAAYYPNRDSPENVAQSRHAYDDLPSEFFEDCKSFDDFLIGTSANNYVREEDIVALVHRYANRQT